MDKDEIRKLANSGDAEAMYQLGLMYESGDGMMQNTSIALKRFREAADKGHDKAKEKLQQLRPSISGSFMGKHRRDWSDTRRVVLRWT